MRAARVFDADDGPDGVAITRMAPQPETDGLAPSFHHITEHSELRSRAILENHFQTAIMIPIGQGEGAAIIGKIQSCYA